MRGNIVRPVVKAVARGVDPSEFILSFFRENADYGMSERELERAIRNALAIVDFVRENGLLPAPPVIVRTAVGEPVAVMFDGVFPDGRRLIVENSDDYMAKLAAARPGDVIVRVERDFSIKVVGVVK